MNSKNSYVLAKLLKDFPLQALSDTDISNISKRIHALAWLGSLKAMALSVYLEPHEGETDDEAKEKKRERDEIDAEIKAFIAEGKKNI